jgi:hypothetical protein
MTPHVIAWGVRGYMWGATPRIALLLLRLLLLLLLWLWLCF